MSSLARNFLAPAAGGFSLLFALAPQAAHAVIFVPGTYHLAETPAGAAVDTLVVTVSGGIADFTLTGDDTATFSVPESTAPTGEVMPGNPYYYVPGSSLTASWNTSSYPYLTFWTAINGGGITAGSQPGDNGSNDFNLFEASGGQILAPEPASWMILLLGLGGVGGAMRLRPRPTSA